MDKELSDELKKLNENIEKMGRDTTIWSKVLAFLTAILLVVALVQVAFMVKDFVITDWKDNQKAEWVVGVMVIYIIICGIAYWFARDINKKL